MNKPAGAASEPLVSMEAPAESPVTPVAAVESDGSPNVSTRAAGAAPDRPSRPTWVAGSATVLLSVSVLALLFSLIVTFYNVRYSYIRVAEIGADPVGTVTESGTRAFPVSFPEWVRPYMQDLSVVSPSLVAFTAACMALGSILMIWYPAAAARASSVHFPFPASYKTYYIQFGLLGTIIGFVIAFSDIDLAAERQTLVLVEALGTALWSTLTALLLSYGICPLIELAYRQLREPLARQRPGDTRSALELLRQRTTDAADSLATLRRSADAMSEELDLHRLETRVGKMEASLAQIAEELGALTKAMRASEEGQMRTADETRALGRRADRSEEQWNDVDHRVQEITRSLGIVTASADDLGRRITEIKENDLSGHDVRIEQAERRLEAIVRALKNVAE